MRTTPWLLIVTLAALVSPVATAQQDDFPPEQEPPDRMERLRQNVSQMLAGLRQFSDWDTHREYIVDAVEHVYERNDWTSEPDLFSLEMIRDVSEIPPWQVRERFDRATELISDRYLLNRKQEETMRRLVLRENFRIFSQHADRIMQYGMEAIQTRAAGRPFTPEQVARWAELAQPVFLDVRRSLNRSAEEFMDVLEPEQKELVKADLEAANHRMQDVQQLAQRWQQGQWDPADWGLEEDPIQNSMVVAQANEAAAVAAAQGGAQPGGPDAKQPRREPPQAGQRSPRPQRRRPTAGPSRGGAPVRPPAPQTDPQHAGKTDESRQPDDEWARYVRAFIAKYQLNDEQQQRAWLFYKDARTRADAAEQRHERLTKGLSAEDQRGKQRLRELNERKRKDLGRLFDRLKERLEPLPTRAQRRAAQPSTQPSKDRAGSEKNNP
jgi:hypothetical protein